MGLGITALSSLLVAEQAGLPTKHTARCHISYGAPLTLFSGSGLLNHIFRPQGLSKQVGEQFKCVWCVCVCFHSICGRNGWSHCTMGNLKTLGYFQICQPFGENTFPKIAYFRGDFNCLIKSDSTYSCGASWLADKAYIQGGSFVSYYWADLIKDFKFPVPRPPHRTVIASSGPRFHRICDKSCTTL